MSSLISAALCVHCRLLTTAEYNDLNVRHCGPDYVVFATNSLILGLCEDHVYTFMKEQADG